MQKYTIEQLSDAATYAADEELATLARRVAQASDLDMPTGERKRLALAGGMAEAVHAALAARYAADDEAAKDRAANVAVAEALPLPAGWTLRVAGEVIELAGPYDDTMHASLKRHGRWNADARRWDVPLNKVETLARSLKRQAKGAPERAAAAQAAAQAKAQATQRVELERWLRYVEDKAPSGYLYQRGVDECRSRGIRNHSELAARLDAAVATARRVSDEQRAAQQRQRDAERAAREPLLRHLYPSSKAPRIGVPVEGLHGQPVVYTGSGQSFRINESHPSTCGEHLLGHEGETGAYFYYREATATEVEQLEVELAAEAEAAHAAAARRAEVKALAADVQARGERLVDHVGEPTGQVVSDNRDLGVGIALIVADDAVYCVHGYNDNWDFRGMTGANYWRTTDPEIRQRALALLPND